MDAILLHPSPLHYKALHGVPINRKMFIFIVRSLVVDLQCFVKEVTTLSRRLAGALFFSESLVFPILHNHFESANVRSAKHVS